MKVPATTQKLRGGYYTPQAIACFLADWAIQDVTSTILEPSCGDGNILEAAVETLLRHGARQEAIPDLIQGVELDPIEANKAIQRLVAQQIPVCTQIHIGDFFEYCRDNILYPKRFDAIIGNPPFVRYQNFDETQRKIAFRIMEQAGMRPTRLTNTWVPFLVASTFLLNEHGGRLAMVIPAELLQVNYAAELRRFLTTYYSRITLITFKKLVFAGIQQEVVLFLGERNGYEHTGMRVVELDQINDLADYKHVAFSLDGLKHMDHSKEKWTQYFLDQDEIDLLRALRTDTRLTIARKVIDVDVGIVTGQNEFFVLPEQVAIESSLMPYTQPIVTRSAHLSGITFTQKEFLENTAKQYPSRLLIVPRRPFNELPEPLQHYIAMGEKQGYHTGYKCRIREHWYTVPSIWSPGAFMLRQVHNYPKIILNQTEATCTDTIHRIKLISQISPRAITSAFLNSLTFAFSEVMGRSYGGGVLELEPNEAEALPLPLKKAEDLDFDHIHDLIVHNDIEAVLNLTDQTLLIDGLGLSLQEVSLLRGAWRKLRDRRIHRKHDKIKVAPLA